MSDLDNADSYFTCFPSIESLEICDRAKEVLLRNLGQYFLDHSQDDAALIVMENARARVDTAIELASQAESPIEEIMAAILAFCNTGYGQGYVDAQWGGPPPDFGAIAYPQVESKGYRVDFLIGCYCAGLPRLLIIECDGHEFHERTKEQAARDKARDRKLSSKGAAILRFTGSEIYREPYRIRAEIDDALLRTIEQAIADADLKRHKAILQPITSGDAHA